MKATLYFCGFDEWDRPVFRCVENNRYFCDTEHLSMFKSGTTEQDIIEIYKKVGTSTICYKGRTFDAEPDGGRNFEFEIITNKEAKLLRHDRDTI